MKVRTTVLLLLMLCIGATLCFAADPSLGTWKLNEAKSKIDPGLPKNVTVVYEAEGNSIKSTVDGFDGKGNPVHSVWTGKFDGKDYPVSGGSAGDTRSYKQINDHTLSMTLKTGGKVTSNGKIVVSADGMSRTVNLDGTDSAGKKVSSTAVYDKQ